MGHDGTTAWPRALCSASRGVDPCDAPPSCVSRSCSSFPRRTPLRPSRPRSRSPAGPRGPNCSAASAAITTSTKADQASPTCCERRSTSCTATPRPQRKRGPEGAPTVLALPRGRGTDRVERRIRRDRLRIGAQLDHRGLAGSDAALERGPELSRVLDDLAHRAEAARERGEVRVHDVGADHAPGIVLLLVHANGAVDAVVHDEDDHRRVVLHGGGELLARHEEVAVAREADYGALGARNLGGDRGWHALAHVAPGRGPPRAPAGVAKGAMQPRRGIARALC